jgi:hypothetical protein
LTNLLKAFNIVVKDLWQNALMDNLFCEFDMKALHAALDAERQLRHLSWIELTTEINEPIQVG